MASFALIIVKCTGMSVKNTNIHQVFNTTLIREPWEALVAGRRPSSPGIIMPLQPATPASVILEVISRTCGLPVRESHTLRNDLHMSSGDLLELRMALELALQFEFGDLEIDGGIIVEDLIEAIIGRAKAA